ncbi:MAG: glycosyltransferase family 4 protein [Pseudomonadales bacterium]|nr:glycosyltransferase family 4 protein [Pseudomonadales bacterium]
MKILYLHQYFFTPEMYGGTRSYEMARRMVAKGHEVHMVTSRQDVKGCEKRYEVVDGIKVHWIPVPYNNNMSYIRRIFAFLQFAFLSSVKSINIKCDVIFATSTPLTIIIPAIAAKMRHGVPIVFEVRDLWPELPILMGALESTWMQCIAHKMESLAYHSSVQLVGLSPGMCDGIAKVGIDRSRIHNIPNSCDNELFMVDESCGKQFRNKFEWLKDRPLVVYTGTLGKINGVCYFAELAAEMLKKNEDICFLVVGRGADEIKVREKARELGVLNKNFYMLPPVSKNEMPEILSAATVCSSLFIPIEEMWNNSANKLFDAMAAGKPVMINYGGWQKKIIEQHGNGIVVDSLDMNKASETLLEFIKDQASLDEASEASLLLSKTEFNRDHLADKLIAVIESALDDRSVAQPNYD